MAKKLLCYLIFIVLETWIVAASTLVVLFGYLPFVAIKGLVMTLTGKARPRALSTSPSRT